jgi:hypothetical protein
MRERLDCHSRYLESQIAGLEALVQDRGETDVVVPPLPDRLDPTKQRFNGPILPSDVTAVGSSENDAKAITTSATNNVALPPLKKAPMESDTTKTMQPVADGATKPKDEGNNSEKTVTN